MKGGVPVANSYKITPKLQRSAVWLYGYSLTTYGAIYNGVPFNEVSTYVL